jgi:hypothetical protein
VRWPTCVAVIGLAGLLSAASPADDAADVLGHSSVYVDAGAREVIDVSRRTCPAWWCWSSRPTARP